MKIIVSARLKPSQIKYKIIPLAKSNRVDVIYLLRKEKGPEIEKVKYIVLPGICRLRLFNILLTPFLLAYHSHKKGVDLIVTYNFLPHGFFGFMASKLTGIPFNYSQIDTNTMEIVSGGGIKGKMILNMIRSAFFINMPGSKSKSFWVQQGIQADRINILHSTIDTDNEFVPATDVKKDFDFIYVGVLESRKRVGLVIEALSTVTNKKWKFAIVGDGSEKDNLTNKVSELKLEKNIVFLGHQRDVKSLMARSRYFVLTSKIEGIPCAMMEAMACELIPIVTDVADISDVVNQKNGFLLSGDPGISELAEILEYALSNYNSLAEMRSNARKTIIENHSYTSAISKWNSVLDLI